MRCSQDLCPVRASVATWLGAWYLTTILKRICIGVLEKGDEKILDGGVEWEYQVINYSTNTGCRSEL